MQRLPPLYALRAFEAVARHLSFRKAAEELYVTPAAVSQQIKTLEDYLGFPLFRRTKNALALTEAAQAGLPQVREGFEHLAKAARQMREHHRSSDLTVLHDEIAVEEGRPGWAGWLRAAGIEDIDPERGSYFSHTLLALEAAVAGQGVVLALKLLTEAELAAGRLVIPFGPELVLPQGYYLLICPRGIAQQPRIAAFRDWLLGEVAGAGKRAGVR